MPTLGVIVVSFRSGDVILECLESLLASIGVRLKIVVVENASPDDTLQVIRDWASGVTPFVRPNASPLPGLTPIAKPLRLAELQAGAPVGELGLLTLIHANTNLGFAGGVNVGLKALDGQVDWLWVLNPDCVVPPDTALAFATAAAAHPGFSLMGGRAIYYATPDRIQTDGGKINRLTGNCSQFGYGAPVRETAMPMAEDLAWVSGASMLVSPAFFSKVGPMREDYFLYFEEVDWAFRRGDLPLAVAPGALVYHHGGTAIGSGSFLRRASPFANYFNHRNRIRFARRFISPVPIWAYLFGLAKAVQLALKGGLSEAHAVIAGMFELKPPREVAARFQDPAAAQLALGRHARPPSGRP